MRKRTLGVVLVAGLAMSGAGAFTASNTVTAVNGGTSNIAGYGDAVATGAVITSIAYTPNSTDASKLDTVTWRSSDNLTGKSGEVTLLDSAGAVMGTAYDCVVTYHPVSTVPLNTTAYSEGVCDTSAVGPSILTMKTVGITVHN